MLASVFFPQQQAFVGMQELQMRAPVFYTPGIIFFLCSVAVTVWVVQSCAVLGGMHVGSQAQGNTSSKSETEGKNGCSVLHVPHEPCRRQVVRAGGSPEVAALAKLVFPGSS